MKMFKYELTADVNTIEVPQFTQFVAAGHQQGVGLVVWAMVPDNPEPLLGHQPLLKPGPIKRTVVVIYTDMDVPDPRLYTYLATVQAYGLVYHLFVDLE